MVTKLGRDAEVKKGRFPVVLPSPAADVKYRAHRNDDGCVAHEDVGM